MTPQEMDEIDRWLAENVMGYTTDQQKIIADYVYPFSPTRNIAQAFEVVEKLRTTLFKWFEMAHRPAGFICNFVGDPKYTEFAETPTLAICLAAKKALEGR